MFDTKRILCTAAVCIAVPAYAAAAYAAAPPAGEPCSVLARTDRQEGPRSVVALRVKCPGVPTSAVAITHEPQPAGTPRGEQTDLEGRPSTSP
jgi:hypothetical protein